MSNDMKLQIAQAGERLLNEKNRKKLTVTDIVEECHITRQTFYYHFKDIPDMILWNIQRKCNNLSAELSDKKSIEEIVEYCLTIIIEHRQYGEKIMASNYGDIVADLVVSTMRKAFLEMAEKKKLFPDNTVAEKKMIVTYYSYAIGGVMKDWDMIGIDDVGKAAKILIQLVSGDIRFSKNNKCMDIACRKEREKKD